MTDYYVDSAASAGGDGLTRAGAWDTLADLKLNEGSLSGGDTVHIYGTFNEVVSLDIDGEQGNNVVLQFHGASVSGAGLTTENYVIRIDGSYVTLRGDPDAWGSIDDCAHSGNAGNNLLCDVVPGLIIENMSFAGSNFSGCLLRSCRNAKVEKIKTIDNAAKGFVCGTTAGGSQNQRGIVIDGLYATGNGRFGVQIGGTNGETTTGVNYLKNVKAVGNGTGLKLEDADDWIVENVHAWDNSLVGEGGENGSNIWMQNSQRATIRYCVLLETRKACIDMDRSNTGLNKIDGARIYSNWMRNSLGHCIDMQISTVCDDNIISYCYMEAGAGYAENELVRLTRSDNSHLANCTLVGATDGISLTFLTNQADGWTLSNNIFTGQSALAVQGGAGITQCDLQSNAYVGFSLNVVIVKGATYTTANITNLDSTAIVKPDLRLIESVPDDTFVEGFAAGVYIDAVHRLTGSPNPPGVGFNRGHSQFLQRRRRISQRTMRRRA